MSLTNRVFVFFGALMILLVTSQWYMMRSITQDVSSELGKVAFSVAKDTASFFVLGNFQWVTGQNVTTTVMKDGEEVTIRIDENTNTKIRVNRSAIARVVVDDDTSQKPKDKDADK